MSPKRINHNYAQVYKLVFASLGGRGGTNATAPPGDGCKRGSASSGLKRVRGLDYKAQVWLSGAFQDISPAICSQIEKIAYLTHKKIEFTYLIPKNKILFIFSNHRFYLPI